MISFEGANPRHEHEWRVFQEVKLPPGKVIIPGVLDSVSNAVEHPRVVADRIVRFANVVGRENLIAGTDCGFATFAASVIVHPTIAWAKLRSLTEGAKLASEELWPRSPGPTDLLSSGYAAGIARGSEPFHRHRPEDCALL